VLTQRPIDPVKDKDFVLALVCMANYENVPARYQETSYRAYRDRWFNSDIPRQIMASLKESLADPKTVAEVWLEDEQPVGLLWLEFYDSPQQRMVANLRNLVVEPAHQRRGIGKMMLQEAESAAREKGADVLRSETSVENEGTQYLLQRSGFTVAYFTYEKVLETP
jgi:ribosomal protein S18 acetylase RimI-like enzyme